MTAKHPSRRHIARTVDDLGHGHWIRRQAPAGSSLRAYGEEHAINTITGAVLDAIEDAELSRAEVARLLGTTKSYISQVLNGSTNMTLKTLGALLWATGQQVAGIRLEEVAAEENRQITAFPYLALTTQSAPSQNMTYTGNAAQYLYRTTGSAGMRAQ